MPSALRRASARTPHHFPRTDALHALVLGLGCSNDAENDEAKTQLLRVIAEIAPHEKVTIIKIDSDYPILYSEMGPQYGLVQIVNFLGSILPFSQSAVKTTP